MRTTLQITSEPVGEPVSLDLAKRHCRLDHDSDDLLMAGYIRAARMMAEMYLSRVLLTQTLQWTVMPESSLRPDVHFLRQPLDLPRAPVQSISSVVVLDELGNSTTIAAATLPIVPPQTLQGYLADLTLQPARLTIGMDTVLSDGRTIRSATLQHAQITFVAGYGSLPNGADSLQAIPQPIIQAILLTIGHLYENRGDVSAEMPQAAQWLLDPYRIPWVG